MRHAPGLPIPVDRTESPLRLALQGVAASWRAKLIERMQINGMAGYLLIWLVQPIVQMSMFALVYRARPDLLRYAVVGIAAQAFIFNAIFYLGEILDRERISGTLPALFLAPCPRLGWLGGFALVGLFETLLVVAAGLLFGHLALGVAFDPDVPAVLLTLLLFIAALWGLGCIFSAIGLVIKKSNQFSNLVFPFVILLGGVYYPVALLPDWLRYPARTLPLGYALQALAGALLDHAGIIDLAPHLLPLAGFALALPVAGALAFRWLDRLVRERGELDVY